MNRTRLIFALALGLLLVVNCYATDYLFMGFDEIQQKMFAVARGDQELHVYVTYDQSNQGGWIGDYNSYGQGNQEVVCEAPMSPNNPDRLTDIPAGQQNVITALVDFYDVNYQYLYTLETHDTLEADSVDGNMFYLYTQQGCDWVLPDTIRINTAFCATVCHGARSVPIFCEDPNYNPDLLEVTVSNGCHNPETHCNNPDCAPVDWSLFSWQKRVFGPCNYFLSMTYCGEGPGCVCIWRSDFFLPVEMHSFTATAGDGRVTINWSAGAESQLNEYRVTRSTRRDDGYTQVTAVAAANSPTGHSYTWVDENVQNGVTYYYKLHIVDANGNAHVYNLDNHTVIASATPGAGLGAEYALSQNYPNPFNSQTSFSFSLASADRVTLKVYDLLGREVAEVLNQNMNAGKHSINWSADGLASGVYMYTLKSGSFTESKKLLFLK